MPASRFKNLFRRKKRNSREVLCSHEQNDEQMVKKALERSKRLPLSVDDFFDVFGRYSPMYVRSIFLNAFLWGMGHMHYWMDEFISQTNDVFQFYDINGHFYGEADDEIGNQQYDETATRTIRIIVSIFSLLGVIFLLFKYKYGRRRVILECGLMYGVCSMLFISQRFGYDPVIRVGIALTSLFNKAIRISILLHLSESLPAHMMPYAFAVMNLMNGAMITFFNLFLGIREIDHNWSDLGVVLGIAYSVSCIFYVIFSPPAVLRALTTCKGETIRQCLAKWVKNADAIDVNALIDDTMFNGKPLVSEWIRVWELLRVKVFTVKLVALALLRCSSAELRHGGESALKHLLSIFYYDERFIVAVTAAVSGVLGAIILSKLGRRVTIIATITIGIISHLIFLQMRLDEYDVCSFKTIPNKIGRILVFITALLAISMGTVSEMAILTTILHHIPVQQHSILVPMTLMFSTFLNSSCVWMERIADKFWEDYQNPSLTVNFIYVVFSFPAVIFIDNSSTLILTAADIPAYYFPRTPYPEHPKRNDVPPGQEEDTISLSVEG